jgi:AcrR family transcriptional regulator
MSSSNYGLRMTPQRQSPREQSRRRRLSVDERRAELLRIGMRLFSTRAYEEIWVEEIAELAGISRGLLYHYFPTKRDFYVAVSRAAAAEAGELTAPDTSLPPLDRLHAGIDAFVRYAEEHSQGFLTAYRGSLAGDPEVRAIVEGGRQRQAARIMEIVAPENEPQPLLWHAVHGWIALAQDIIARWLQERDATREAVCELLRGALSGVIEGAMETEKRTRSPVGN